MSYNNGTMALSLAKAQSDGGQALMITASGSDADYSFHITFQDGTDAYFTAKVMSFKTTIGGVDSILGASATLELNSDVVETA